MPFCPGWRPRRSAKKSSVEVTGFPYRRFHTKRPLPTRRQDSRDARFVAGETTLRPRPWLRNIHLWRNPGGGFTLATGTVRSQPRPARSGVPLTLAPRTVRRVAIRRSRPEGRSLFMSVKLSRKFYDEVDRDRKARYKFPYGDLERAPLRGPDGRVRSQAVQVPRHRTGRRPPAWNFGRDIRPPLLTAEAVIRRRSRRIFRRRGKSCR